jgi:hypothetical protein
MMHGQQNMKFDNDDICDRDDEDICSTINQEVK